jgi:hypothetical protein
VFSGDEAFDIGNELGSLITADYGTARSIGKLENPRT